MQVRRSRYVFLFLESRKVVDIGCLLAGEIEARREQKLVAISLAGRGEQIEIDGKHLELLRSVPDDRWIRPHRLPIYEDGDAVLLADLCSKGVLLSDADEPAARAMRSYERSLRRSSWEPTAALYVSQLCKATLESKNNETARSPSGAFQAIVANSPRSYEEFVRLHGPPPSPFYERSDAEARVELPVQTDESPLGELLRRRKTRRSFDGARALALGDLSQVLYRTFGFLGMTSLGPGVTAAQRGSPSAGSLHPIEGFVLIRDVVGLLPGIYHYNSKHYCLDRIKQLKSAAAAELLVKAMAGQSYAVGAHAMVIMVARFDRNMWKYRGNVRAPWVVAMDAGHLSQTFYLACAEIGLGCFFSAAIEPDILEEKLGLDAINEMAVGALGCGNLTGGHDSLALEREPIAPSGSRLGK